MDLCGTRPSRRLCRTNLSTSCRDIYLCRDTVQISIEREKRSNRHSVCTSAIMRIREPSQVQLIHSQYSDHAFRPKWMLIAGLHFASKGPGNCALAANSSRPYSNAADIQQPNLIREIESTINSSKVDNAANFSGQYMNEILSGPHLESHNVPLDMMTDQPCNARGGSDYAKGESIDPACVMLFQANRSQLCARRLPPVNAHAEQCRPDFFILGTRKGGSTSLYAYITSHPNVYRKPVNEGQIEEQLGENFNRVGSEAYNREYSGARSCQYVLDSSVARLTSGAKDLGKYCAGQHESTGLNARQHARGVPFGTEPRFIILLREPVKKCYSRLSMQVRFGSRSNKTNFDEAVSSELKTFLKNTHLYQPLDVIKNRAYTITFFPHSSTQRNSTARLNQHTPCT